MGGIAEFLDLHSLRRGRTSLSLDVHDPLDVPPRLLQQFSGVDLWSQVFLCGLLFQHGVDEILRCRTRPGLGGVAVDAWFDNDRAAVVAVLRTNPGRSDAQGMFQARVGSVHYFQGLLDGSQEVFLVLRCLAT